VIDSPRQSPFAALGTAETIRNFDTPIAMSYSLPVLNSNPRGRGPKLHPHPAAGIFNQGKPSTTFPIGRPFQIAQKEKEACL